MSKIRLRLARSQWRRNQGRGWASDRASAKLFPIPSPLLLVFQFRMIVALPTKVADSGFVNSLRHFAEIGGNVMFESLMANVPEQLLQLRNFRHAGAAEGLERIVGELAWSCIAANHSAPIVGGVAGIRHRAGLHFAHAGAEGVLL